MMKHLRIFATIALLITGCDQAGPPHPDAVAAATALSAAPPLGQPAATVGAATLGADELAAFWAMHPGWTREQAAAAWTAQAALSQVALKDISRFDSALLDDGRRRGLVRALMAREVEAGATTPPPADELTPRVAQLRRESLERPAGLQVSHLVVAVPREVPDAEREALFARARQALDQLVPLIPARPTALELGDLADRAVSAVSAPLVVRSDAHMTFMRTGQPPLAKDELPAGWLEVVAEFAQAAEPWATPERLGARSEPVRTPFGWHVLVVERVIEARGPDDAALTARALAQADAAQRQQRLIKWFEPLLEPVSMAIYQKILDDPGQQ